MDSHNIDRKKIIGEVAAKLNVLLNEDDPIFATVILNEMVLSNFIEVASNELAGILVLIKHVEASLGRSTSEAVSQLNIKSEKILNSVDLLTNQANEIDKLRIQNIEAAAKSSAEFAIQDSYKRVSELMDPMIDRVINGIDQSIFKLKESLNAVQTLHSDTAKSVVKSVNEAILKLKSERNRTVIYCMLSSTLGSAVTCGIAIAIFKRVL